MTPESLFVVGDGPLRKKTERFARRNPGAFYVGGRAYGAELAGLYPRWSDFQEIRRELDPDGVFMNEHLRRVLG